MPYQICKNPACAKEFYVDPCIVRSGKGHYCSRQCVSDAKPYEVLPRFWENILKTETCWIWQGTKFSKGYGNFFIKTGMRVLAHRFSYELVYGLLLPCIILCHKCDNPPCVNPEHLYPGTKKDNAVDAVERNRLKTFANGIPNPKTILKAEDIPYIRAMRGIITSTQLGKKYGVSDITIRTIWQRRSWNHIP